MKLSWAWHACTTPKALSFRATTTTTTAAATVNVVESPDFVEEYTPIGSPEEDAVEAVIRGLRKSTERLFFEPEETSLIVVEQEQDEVKKSEAEVEAVAVEVESEDPCLDFKKSMVEMVEAYGLKEWESLEELLSWYLRVNTKKNHGYVVRAFLDLLICLDATSSCSSSSSLCKNTSSSCHQHCCCCSSSSTTTTTSGGGDSSYVTISTNTSNACCSSTSSTTSPCLSCSFEAEDEEEEIRTKTVFVVDKDVSFSDNSVV